MYIKFIADDGEVVVETNSYKVYEECVNDWKKTVVINYVYAGGEVEPVRTEFNIRHVSGSDQRPYAQNVFRSAFVMNDRGETVDKIMVFEACSDPVAD